MIIIVTNILRPYSEPGTGLKYFYVHYIIPSFSKVGWVGFVFYLSLKMRKLRLKMLNNLRLHSSGYSNYEQEPEYSSWIEASILNFIQFVFVHFFFHVLSSLTWQSRCHCFQLFYYPKSNPWNTELSGTFFNVQWTLISIREIQEKDKFLPDYQIGWQQLYFRVVVFTEMLPGSLSFR